MRQKSRARQNSIAEQSNIAERSRIVVGIWLCAAAICLGVLLPKTEVMAAGINQIEFTISQLLDIADDVADDTKQELGEQEFEYILEAMESRNPLPPGGQDTTYVFNLKGNQRIKLAPLTFTEVGEYRYQLRLREVKADTAFVGDQEVYEITVYVTNRNGIVRADAIALNKAGFKNEELTFTHSYLGSDGSLPAIVPPDTTNPDTRPPAIVAPDSTNPDTRPPVIVPPDSTNPGTRPPVIAQPASNLPTSIPPVVNRPNSVSPNNRPDQGLTIKSKAANTGDTTNAYMLIALFLLSGSIIAFALHKKRS